MDLMFQLLFLWIAGLVFNTIVGDLFIFSMFENVPDRIARKYQHTANTMALVPFSAPLVLFYLKRSLTQELEKETYRTLLGEQK